MARRCSVTGKTVSVGNTRSHSLRAVKRKYLPNLQKKRVFDPETGKYKKMLVSTQGLRTLLKPERRRKVKGENEGEAK